MRGTLELPGGKRQAWTLLTNTTLPVLFALAKWGRGLFGEPAGELSLVAFPGKTV